MATLTEEDAAVEETAPLAVAMEAPAAVDPAMQASPPKLSICIVLLLTHSIKLAKKAFVICMTGNLMKVQMPKQAFI